jgi:AraC-like DNA-binding protein
MKPTTPFPFYPLSGNTSPERPFFGFNIHTPSDCRIDPHTPPRPLPVGGLFFCRSGEVEFLLDRKHYLLREGDMCLVFPFALLQPVRISDPFAGFGMAADLSLFNDIRIPSFADYYLHIKDHPVLSLTLSEQEMLIDFCRRMLCRYNHVGHPFRLEIADSMFRVLYYEVAALYNRGTTIVHEAPTQRDLLFRKFLLLASRHCHRRRSVEYYADALSVSPRYLSAVAKQKSNLTALAWINGLVIRQAKNLIENPHLSIQQVSDELNFANPSFFSQYFKKHTGLTPKAFRNHTKRNDLPHPSRSDPPS